MSSTQAYSNQVNKKVMIIDNYDSFTYNLKQLIESQLNGTVDIIKNDALVIEKVRQYDYIFISPGPGLPGESNQLIPVLNEIIKTKKIFGVCLGLQAIIEVCGGQLNKLHQVSHGIESDIHIVASCPVYNEIQDAFTAGRYHSWIVDKSSVPENIIVNAIDTHGNIMGIHHKHFPVYGVQFHPESIMTPVGKVLISNFLSL